MDNEHQNMRMTQDAICDDLLVDLGLPSGLKWATRNIDVTQPNGFAASPFQYECSFVSWGNTKMYKPVSPSKFDHDFGTWFNSINDDYDGYDPDSIYGKTDGCKLTGNIDPSHDAARANIGTPWRMPTTDEFKELFDNCIYINADGTEVSTKKTDKRVTVNGIVGLNLKSKINGKSVFFACSGYGDGSSWNGRGASGYYWSASFFSARSARYLSFSSNGVYPQPASYWYLGFAVRAVQ